MLLIDVCVAMFLEKRPSATKKAKPQKPLMVNTSMTTPASAPQQLSPTYGKPTPDTHPLLDEELQEPVDVILETRYVQSPQPKRSLKLCIWNYIWIFVEISYTIMNWCQTTL